VIDNEEHLKIIIEFLLFELKTAGGIRDTASPIVEGYLSEMTARNPKN
jgi:hypothetical protein